MKSISPTLLENENYIKNAFENCDDVVMRKISISKGMDILIIYTDNMVKGEAIENAVLTNIMTRAKLKGKGTEEILNNAVAVGEAEEINDINMALDAVMVGDTVIFADGSEKAIQISTKGWPTRGVPEATSEVVVQGPKDAFCESASINTVLVRRRIRDTNLKVLRQKIGERSKSDVAIMYMSDIVREDVLEKVKTEIQSLSTDALLDSGEMEQLMKDGWKSPFPRFQLTERPDKAAAAALEGRVVVIVDNSPFCLIAPATLNIFFQAAEDYYAGWGIMSFVRVMRYCAALFSLVFPGFYIALTTFHPGMLPTALALKIATSRANVPFPTVVEVLIMETAFELLREAGIRLPSAVSSTIGIVGGIIIGQAAVDAGLVSPTVVIVAAFTGICGFAIPSSSLVSAIRLLKYFIIFLSSTLGLYGFWLGLIFLTVHLASLESFGIPYLFPYVSGSINGFEDLKDSIIKFPSLMLKNRPIFARPESRKRAR